MAFQSNDCEDIEADEVKQPLLPLPERVPSTWLGIQPARIMDDVAILLRVRERLRELLEDNAVIDFLIAVLIASPIRQAACFVRV
jgi:hypothetical protein